MKLFSKIILSLMLLSSVFCCLPAKAAYPEVDPSFGLEKTVEYIGKTSGGDQLKNDLTNQKNVLEIIGKVIGVALSLIGIIFLGLMLYAGIMWMTAHGNEEYSKKALDMIFSAIIGLIITLSAYALFNFVFHSINSSKVDDPCRNALGPQDKAGCDTCGSPEADGKTFNTKGMVCANKDNECDSKTEIFDKYCWAPGQGNDIMCCIKKTDQELDCTDSNQCKAKGRTVCDISNGKCIAPVAAP